MAYRIIVGSSQLYISVEYVLFSCAFKSAMIKFVQLAHPHPQTSTIVFWREHSKSSLGDVAIDQQLRVFPEPSEPRILFPTHTPGGAQAPKTPVTGEPT